MKLNRNENRTMKFLSIICIYLLNFKMGGVNETTEWVLTSDWFRYNFVVLGWRKIDCWINYWIPFCFKDVMTVEFK